MGIYSLFFFDGLNMWSQAIASGNIEVPDVYKNEKTVKNLAGGMGCVYTYS